MDSPNEPPGGPAEDPTPGLPPGYRVLERLASSDQGAVFRAERGGVPVALRVLGGAGGQSALLELEVLAAVRHEGLAALVDFGLLADGRAYLARSWIDGRTLAEVAPAHDARELGALVARLTPALDALHRRGFVHADLKPTNVIVRPSGEPVLTDFGLARRSGGAGELPAGSLFYIAPEALLGAPLDPRADLFALGVMLHEFLCDRRVPASVFYARFPAEDFSSAVGAGPEDLPEWSRELVLELLERDPARRPASALEVGRRLAARLGAAVAPVQGRPSLRVPPWSGRTDWAVSRLVGTPAMPRAWSAAAGEDTLALAAELRLALTLASRRALDADLTANARGSRDLGALDAWALDVLSAAGDGVLVAALEGADDPWSLRAAEHLARTWHQTREESPCELVLVAPPGIVLDETLWNREDVPPVPIAELEALLERVLEPTGADIARLAAALGEAAGGAASVATALLERALERGLLVPGEDRLRLRVDEAVWERELAADVGDATDSVIAGEPERELLALVALAGGELSLPEALAALGTDASSVGRRVEKLVEAGVLVARQVQGVVRLVARRRARAWSGLELEEARWRALAGRRADDLAARGATADAWLPLRLRAEPDPEHLAHVCEEAARLREIGLGELALRLVQDSIAALQSAGVELLPELVTELGEAWGALGLPERAEEAAQLLEGRTSPAARAAVERLRGRVATLRADLDIALAHFARAAELDPECAGAALHARILALYNARRDVELDALLASEDTAKLPARLAGNVRAVHALSRFRRGDVAGARQTLEEELARTQRGEDRQAVAMTRLNLATVLRRTGDTQAACEELERAEALFDASGHLPGLAQARALLAGVLRDRGETRRAEPLLRSAIALRERLGERTGADAARGMYGLLCAEQGRVRAALEELGVAAERFERTHRRTDAALARARLDELRARIGDAGLRGNTHPRESQQVFDADPRILVARARAAWMSDDRNGAAVFARRAGELGARLGLAEPQDEAELLVALLTQPLNAPLVLSGTARTPRVAEDRKLLTRLAGDTLDVSAALAWARELEARGRSDRAARLAIAVVARAADAAVRREAAEFARTTLEACERGLTEAQRRALRRNLFSFPDPFPQDLEAFARSTTEGEDLEMDVLSLIDINRKLVRQEDLPALLGTIVESAIAVTGAERGFLVLEEGGRLAFDTARDSRRGEIEEPELEVSRSILEQALASMSPVRVSNAVDDPLHGGAPSIAALELRSILCVPLEVEDGLRGAIYVDHRIRAGAFAERAEKLLSLLADQAALAIRQVRRYDEIRGLNARLEQRVAERDADLAIARRELQRAGAVVPASGLVGSSEPMQRIHRLIDRFAPAALAVLVTGQSGTGKELVARALHALSPRSEGPFISESCAALPPTLVEAELFGYKRGAFTGAESDRAGIFERAHGGTLFLDEIGELAPELQAKLLRVLETSEVRRLGDSRVVHVDFRLVAATNRDLSEEVQAGRFREDLYYRLDALRIELPPLSVRVEDIPDLAHHFLARENAHYGTSKQLTPAVLAALCRREWPGNVRELANEVSRLWVMSEGDLDDPTLVRTARPTSPDRPSPTDLVRPLAELERQAIEAALERVGGDKRRAAQLLGISRAKIYQRLQEWRQESDAADERG